jgi:hypothetical protein
MNRKGQFSIIAALFVAIILISSVMVTYSTIRYSSAQDQPQIMSAVDETNLALKQVLGFTVGYFGSILQVTGNSSYAYAQSETYLDSGLNNIADINPQWATSINVTSLALGTDWFMNDSYSEGTLNVTYNLMGLGITGVAYSVSCALNVQISPSSSNNQVCLTVTQDGNEPVVDLSTSNFKFYLYQDSNLTWGMASPPSEPVSSSNGTYTIAIPTGINPQSYVILVTDTRGIMVAASSFSKYTGTLTFNTTTVTGGDYVNQYDSMVDGVADEGTHSNFTAQQQAPNGAFDTLTEAQTSSPTQNYNPTGYSLGGSTTLSSGSLTDLTKNNSPYMSFQSYASASQYGTITYDSSNSAYTNGAGSLSWTQTTGTGSNRILLVSVDIFSYNTPTTVSSVTYGATTLPSSSSYTALYSASNPEVRSYVYYLVNPSSGANTVKVSFTSSTTAVCGSITYLNVNQASPIYAENSVANSGTSQSSSSVTASGACTQLLYGNIATSTQSNSYSVTDAGTQNNRWSNSASYTHSNKNYYNVGKGSDKSVSTSGSASVSWSTTLSVNWVGIAILLQPTQTITQETCQVTFSGSSNPLNWNSLIWAIDAESSIANTGFTLQLYNYNTGQYPTSPGNGYQTVTLGTTNATEQQTISTNPGNFRTAIGSWQLCLTATASVSSAFTISLDLALYAPSSPVYGLSLEEEWTNLNSTETLNPTLCIYAGSLATSNLAVDAWYNGAWQTVSSQLVNGWNNFTANSYIANGATTFAIRFINTDGQNSAQDSWQVSSVLLRPESDQSLFTSLQSPAATVAVELLQNGTMIWLGQNMTVTSQSIPIPPVPVKAINVNETIDGVNEQVPFQIEDWASDYTIPLGLTNNATIFGNMQMVVFLVNTQVSQFTVWWNGSDQAIQSPLAYASSNFKKDNPANNFLSNGQLSLQFSGSFAVTSTILDSGTTSTANFMNINNQPSEYGSGVDYVIYNGTVRDIVQQEAEWGGGIHQTLYVNSFNNTNTQWTTTGSSPYLGNSGGANYISTNGNNKVEGWFGFQNLNLNTFADVSLEFNCYCSGDDYIQFQVTDGVSTYGWFNVTNLPSSYGVVSYDLSSFITSATQLNNLKVNIRYVQVGSTASTIYINQCDLNVVTVPNFYADVVLTLPANATYYTYQTTLMFINSTLPRDIAYLCPISLSYNNGQQVQTENGISNGAPVVSTNSAAFSNSTGTWQHHWSQLTSGSQGAGIMFTDQANQMLYAFDSIAGSPTGALTANLSTETISLLPVTLNPVWPFESALDITWCGAVVTFDSSVPAIYSGQGEADLWILAEVPPTIAVTCSN